MGQKKRSPDQGLKLLLIRDYLYNEASAEHPRNSKDIQAFLAEHEIKASTRTIQEDVRRLRDILNIPIAYNPQKWGYTLTYTLGIVPIHCDFSCHNSTSCLS